MAPEQFEGRFSPASDVYAMGVVAYEMMTGRHPFNAELAAAIQGMQMEGVRVKPRDLRRSIPEAAQDCILKALAYDAGNRYARARDFGDALSVALGGPPLQQTNINGSSAPATLEIAHVLFMDLVGYSALSMELQTKYQRMLNVVVEQTPEFRRADADGTLLSLPAGDGMALVFFGDPTAPARCSLSIAAALRSQPELRLRMGLHTGPVYRVADIRSNSNVAGGGINVAQRVMDCGDAGHILLSRSIAEVPAQFSDWASRLHDLGEYTVKHGMKIQVYNLTSGDLGNPTVPEKLRPYKRAPLPRFMFVTLAVCAILAVLVVCGLIFQAPLAELLAKLRLASIERITQWVALGSGRTQPSSQSEKTVSGPMPPSPPPVVKQPNIPAGTVRVNEKDHLKYVWVPPGRFTMGCSPEDCESTRSNEKPAHKVEITKGFWLGRTEVTQAAYQSIVGKNPSFFKGSDRPVEMITWNEAQQYCQKIGGRLPTEAEWEYAARAADKDAERLNEAFSRWGLSSDIAWDSKNSNNETHPVARKDPNAWGLYDMLGNVWELVTDWYQKDYYATLASPAIDPQGPRTGTLRVLRGGSFDVVGEARAAYRGVFDPSSSGSMVGFRCAWEATP